VRRLVIAGFLDGPEQLALWGAELANAPARYTPYRLG
jgi:hypothetical protein